MTGIYLRSADGTMGKQLLDSIGVSTEFNLQRSVCMAEAVVVKPEINGRQMEAIKNLKR